MQRTTLFYFFILLLSSFSVHAADIQIHRWEAFELSLKAKRQYQNPYAAIPAGKQEGLVQVIFSGVDGEARGKKLVLFGFWDGGQTWKVRFAAPYTGNWSYKSSSADAGLAAAKGTLNVVDWPQDALAQNNTLRGPVQVQNGGGKEGHYFKYADGTPFLWIGDTWWNWTKRGIKFSTYKTLVDDRAAKGFNLGQLFVAANGWGRPSSLLDSTFSVLDVAHMQKVDSLIRYANAKGITVWVHGWWSRENLNKTAGEEKIKRWWRYLVHRLGAYNVVWVIAGEYNLENYGGMGLPFWKDLGAMIKKEDPYDRVVSAHNTPPNWSGGMEAPQWSTAEILHNEPWMDYNQTQVGHGRMANEMIPSIISKSYSTTPRKPIVVTEPWYEFVEGNPAGRDVRFAAWSAVLSGAAGHTYGGGHVWLAHVPEAPSGAGGAWPLEMGFERNTLDYEGARSMGYLAQFFKKTQWWKMSPHAELVLEYPENRYCLAVPGQEYIVYLRWGGTMKIDLKKTSENDRFQYYWFDPATGKSLTPKEIRGGAEVFLSAPGGYPGNVNFHDWVLHIKKMSP
ncbi:MAG TPA: DUF4038 domain-containing protein [Flavisolibacter sp.]|nr:DUF4038 domain-containing protein [Flavisolibacter sp.]